MSALLAIILFHILLPIIQPFYLKDVSLFEAPFLLVGFLILSICVGLLSGIYPAFIIVRLNLIKALKGVVNHTGNQDIRTALQIIQFSFALAALIITLGVNKQLKLIKNKDMGYEAKNILAVPLKYRDLRSHSKSFKNQIKKKSSVKEVGTISKLPGEDIPIHRFSGDLDYSDNDVYAKLLFVGHDLNKVLNLNLLTGRWFTPMSDIDSASYIINKTMMADLGFSNPDEAIGSIIKREDNDEDFNAKLDDNYWCSRRLSLQYLTF